MKLNKTQDNVYTEGLKYVDGTNGSTMARHLRKEIIVL